MTKYSFFRIFCPVYLMSSSGRFAQKRVQIKNRTQIYRYILHSLAYVLAKLSVLCTLKYGGLCKYYLYKYNKFPFNTISLYL